MNNLVAFKMKSVKTAIILTLFNNRLSELNYTKKLEHV